MEMIKMSENRVDPTVAGLFLVGLITLFFGLLGVLLYTEYDGAFSLYSFVLAILLPLGIVFLVFAVSAIRCGNAFAAALFGFVGIALFGAMSGLTTGSEIAFFLIGVFFILFGLVAFLIGAPKLLAILLIFVALIYVFVGVFVYGAGDDPLIWTLVFGVFGLLAGALATYMAIALSTEKLPVF